MKKELLIAVAIPVLSCAVAFGVAKNQIDNNSKEINRVEIQCKSDLEKMMMQHEKDFNQLKDNQKQNDALLQSINNNLAELNAKVSLLLDGKIK